MIMPMAGRGSRFAATGELRPKPLIELEGLPFFVWATRGILRAAPSARLIYVVLEEHEAQFSITEVIHRHFPQAEVIAIPEVTAGALETALVGTRRSDDDTPLLINDCDHAFGYGALPGALKSLEEGADGFLSHFRSSSPNFSFARYSAAGDLVETAEKRVISDRAIAGIYGFRSAGVLRTAAARYAQNCPYPELFVSGVYNELVAAGSVVKGFDLDFHLPFGTPEEVAALMASDAARRQLVDV